VAAPRRWGLLGTAHINRLLVDADLDILYVPLPNSLHVARPAADLRVHPPDS
jgi:hypothetical protein